MTQPSLIPREKNDLLFQNRRKGFELILATLSHH